MPLVHYRQINFTTKIGVWHITEPETFFLKQVILQKNIAHPHKRLQHLAGRYLLLQLYPNFPLSLIQIADSNKPFLNNDAYHFSISHCGNYAAVIISTECRVGVDIEVPQDKIIALQQKFLSDKELTILSTLPYNTIKYLTMAWSSKEALFKWYGLGGVDFKKNMLILSVITCGKETHINCKFVKENNCNVVVYNCAVAGINNLAWVIT